MSREDDLIHDIEKNLEKEYRNEYQDALIDYTSKGKPETIQVIPTNVTPTGNPRTSTTQLAEEWEDDEIEVEYGDTERRPRKKRNDGLPSKKRRKKHRFLKTLFALIALGLLLVFGIHWLLISFVSKTDYQPYETEYVRASDVKTGSGVTNILVVGSDARNPDADSRSDAMIIVSINRIKHRIVLTSILRDSYVEIPGYGGNKINAAFQYGGPALLIQTIEENFKVGIDYYINIDFFSFVDIINEIGGVTIDVDDEELPYVNSYLNEINSLLELPAGTSYLTASGVQTLNGTQALSYSRIRYVGTDFARTSRQREVINAVLAKFKAQGIGDMLSSAKSILPQLTTNIPDSKMAWYVMEAPWFLTFDQEEFRIPADDTWAYETIDGLDAIRVDLDANSQLWQDAVYE